MKTKYSIFFLAFALCVNTNSKAQVNVQDSLALVDLYNSTDGPDWAIHTNWLTKSAVGTWYGITVTGTRVTGIDLEYNDLSGSIPSSIGKLANLTYLSFWNNQLSGSIPSSIGNLINLKELILGNIEDADNRLSGNIPSSISNLVNLEALVLDHNQLSGNIPSLIGNLKNLILLSLISNQFSGSVPSSITNLVNLRYLLLSNNHLSGGIPSSIGNLVNLVELLLNNNQLSGSIPNSIGNLKNLYELFLQNNKLNGHIPSSIGNLVDRLVYLWLSNNQLSGTIPSSIGNLTVLYLLDLSNNHISDSIPSSVGDLANLYSLYLNNNQLSGSIPSSFRNLRSQMNQNLSHNHFTFDGMELVAKRFLDPAYDHQKNIPVNQNDNTLTVSAGGKLSNNTYKWFKCDGPGTAPILVAIIKGDSTFHPSESGRYRVKVLNAVATQLQLYSSLYNYTTQTGVVAVENELGQPDKTNSFRVYPNPAKDILHVDAHDDATFSLINQSGKILLTKTVNDKADINVSNLPVGLYYLKNNRTRDMRKVIISR